MVSMEMLLDAISDGIQIFETRHEGNDAIEFRKDGKRVIMFQSSFYWIGVSFDDNMIFRGIPHRTVSGVNSSRFPGVKSVIAKWCYDMVVD